MKVQPVIPSHDLLIGVQRNLVIEKTGIICIPTVLGPRNPVIQRTLYPKKCYHTHVLEMRPRHTAVRYLGRTQIVCCWLRNRPSAVGQREGRRELVSY